MATRRRIAPPPAEVVHARVLTEPHPPAEVVPIAVGRARRIPYRQARAEIDRMVEARAWSVDSPELLVGLYGWAHAALYGVEPSDVANPRTYRRACDAASAMLRDHFANQHAPAADYVRWALGREQDREHWRRTHDRQGGRLTWQLLFSARIVDDYTVARVRSRLPASDPAVVAAREQAPDSPPDASGLMFERGDHVELGHALVEILSERSEVVFAENEFHRYASASGLWEPIARGEIARIVQGFAGAPVGTEEKSAPLGLRSGDVKGSITCAANDADAPGFFDGAPRGLAFADCFVTVGDDGKIHRAEHSPDHRARLGYPFAFRAEADCPKWLALLAGYFAGDADADEKIRLLQEFTGAALLGIAPSYQRCLVLHGEKFTGKSTVIDVLAAAMPAGSTTAVAPQTWGSDYAMAELAGKLLNTVSELPEHDILNAASFKGVVTGDATKGRQPYGRFFTFRPRAAHLFACNELPGTADHSGAFWRRFAVLQFNNPIQQRKTDIYREILAAEHGAIVAWLLQGGARLRERGDYVIPASSTAAVADWSRASDQIALYVEERCQPSEGQAHDTVASVLYRDYIAWTRANGHRPLSSTKFGERLGTLGHPRRRTASARLYPLTLRTTAGALVHHRNAERSWS